VRSALRTCDKGLRGSIWVDFGRISAVFGPPETKMDPLCTDFRRLAQKKGGAANRKHSVKFTTRLGGYLYKGFLNFILKIVVFCRFLCFGVSVILPHVEMGFCHVLLKMDLEEAQKVIFRHFWKGGVPYCPIEFLVFVENISVEKN
jgi:hypothetical protein